MKFVFDLDGTICFKGKPVSEKVLTALKETINLEEDYEQQIIYKLAQLSSEYLS